MTQKEFILANNGVFDEIGYLERGSIIEGTKSIDGEQYRIIASKSYVRSVLKKAYGSVDECMWRTAVLSHYERICEGFRRTNTIGFIQDKENGVSYEVYTHDCDPKLSDIPHVHMRDSTWVGEAYGENRFRTCIKTGGPFEYFLHGQYKDVFDERQRMLFDELMHNDYIENDSYRCEKYEHAKARLGLL